MLKMNIPTDEATGLVALVISLAPFYLTSKLTTFETIHEIAFIVFLDVIQFEDVLSQPDPIEDLKKLVDPRLGDNYPLESVHKVKTVRNKGVIMVWLVS